MERCDLEGIKSIDNIKSVKFSNFEKHIKKFRNIETLGIVEAIQFTNNKSDIELFLKGSDLFKKGLIEMEYSMKMAEIKKDTGIYIAMYLQDDRMPCFIVTNLYIQKNDMCLRTIVEVQSKKWLLVWSMKKEIFRFLYSNYKKGGKIKCLIHQMREYL